MNEHIIWPVYIFVPCIRANLLLLVLRLYDTPIIHALSGHYLSEFTEPQNWRVTVLRFQGTRPPAIDGNRVLSGR